MQAERWMVDRNGSYLFLPILVDTLRSQISQRLDCESWVGKQAQGPQWSAS